MQEANIWSANELSFVDDKKHYDVLPPERKRLLEIVIAFFLPGDGMVNNNLIHRFLLDCETSEETYMFIAQMYIETIHAETYGLIAYTLFSEEKMKELQDMADTSPYIGAKAKFIEKWTSSNRPPAERFLAFACVEGIFFSVLFLVIFWFRSFGILPVLMHANKLISEDESLHRNYGCYLHRKRGGVTTQRAMEIVAEAVAVEKLFINWLIGEGIEDLTIPKFEQYLGVVTDNLLVQAGYPTHYHCKNPYPWAETISFINKTNFFEIKDSNYARQSLADALDYMKRAGKTISTTSASADPLSVDF